MEHDATERSTETVPPRAADDAPCAAVLVWIRCGLPSGHDGAHQAQTPTLSAVWSGPGDTA